MTLEHGEIGSYYQVKALKMQGNLLRRLEALGLTVGTTVKVLNRKRNGSVIFSVRGTRLAIGKQIAQEIEVQEVRQGEQRHE